MLAAQLLVLMPVPVSASVAVSLAGGAAYNAPAPLHIRQDGAAVLDRGAARYDTRPFESPPYYAARAGHWKEDRGWELELIHHKLYLRDAPPDVEFAVSHGLNLLLVNRAFRRGPWLWRLGAGPVIAHPETKVRGRALEGGGLGGGYFLSGAAAQLGVERRVRVWKLFLFVEAKASFAWARVPVAGGRASLLNPALHGLFGLGWEPGG